MDFLGWASCGAGQWTLTWDIAALGLLIAATITMLPLETPLLLTLLLVANSLAQRVRPPRPPTLISSIQPKARFNAQQFSGTWLLVGVGSACRFLQEQGHQAEATTLHVTPQGAAMVINTSRKLDGICWQVRQLYRDTEVPGRFLLQAQGARAPVHMVVAATDYQGFAILYLERAKQLSVKLYARSLPVSDSVLSVFEQQVKSANLTEDQILYFPKYGFCKAADQFHILDGEWAAGQLASGHSAGSFLPLAESPVCCRSEGARPAGAVMGHLLPSSAVRRPRVPSELWATEEWLSGVWTFSAGTATLRENRGTQVGVGGYQEEPAAAQWALCPVGSPPAILPRVSVQLDSGEQGSRARGRGEAGTRGQAPPRRLPSSSMSQRPQNRDPKSNHIT
ncbi:complement component C8 gamma chain isoform X2 [Ictidomys tridecemlineatus]